jgi:hypothetical protein
VARHRLLRLRHASGCLGTTRGSSRGSLSITSPTPRVRGPRQVARLVVDYFDYATRSGASARRAASHAARRAARRRLLHVGRASGCLGTLRGSSRGSLLTTSTTPRVRVPRHVTRLVAPLVINYVAYAARPGASAHCAARHAARRRLLRLCRASGCLGTSHGSSCGSSSTTSPTPRVQVPWHVARLVTRLVVDYFDYDACPGASARRAARRAARHRLLRLRRASGCLGTSRYSLSTSLPTLHVRVPRHVARLVVDYFASRMLVLNYFAYAVRPGASARRAAPSPTTMASSTVCPGSNS